MPLRRIALALSAAGAGLLALPASANAADPERDHHRLEPGHRQLPQRMHPRRRGRWKGEGTGVTKVVMNSIDPSGETVYTETANPGEPHGLGADARRRQFGKWTVRVTAYDKSGHILARSTDWYEEKGNTRIKEFNASPEPVHAGSTITVAGRLEHIKFGSPPGTSPTPARPSAWTSKQREPPPGPQWAPPPPEATAASANT